MNRTMKAKNDKRKKLEQQAKKEKFYDLASHRFYSDELPASTMFFWKRDVVAETKMWWDV